MFRIPKKIFFSGLLLALVTLLVFMIIESFKYADSLSFAYYRSLLVSVAFVFPIIYCFIPFYVLYRINKEHELTFANNFRYAFVIMFVGGFLSISLMSIYYNFLHPEAVEIMVNQQVDMMLSFGKNPEEIALMKQELVKSGARDQNIFSFDLVYTSYLPLIILFYLLCSFLLGSFFKSS